MSELINESGNKATIFTKAGVIDGNGKPASWSKRIVGAFGYEEEKQVFTQAITFMSYHQFIVIGEVERGEYIAKGIFLGTSPDATFREIMSKQPIDNFGSPEEWEVFL